MGFDLFYCDSNASDVVCYKLQPKSDKAADGNPRFTPETTGATAYVYNSALSAQSRFVYSAPIEFTGSATLVAGLAASAAVLMTF